ncbi:MAG: CDP-glucose 4,6-dehydratase, partial [Alphaproteobacteria bacterium]|nr:CDP-glucose 4,6-dehydratase [Alphaproteobacteria bacterium]
KPVELRNPRAVRPWQHVLEPLAGYLVLAERLWTDPSAAEGWNFGPVDGDALPVSAVVERVATRWGGGAAWTIQPGEHPHEAAELRLDSTKARTKLGWAPRLGIEQALDWTIDWYRRSAAGESAAALVDAQLAAYATQGVPA